MLNYVMMLTFHGIYYQEGLDGYSQQLYIRLRYHAHVFICKGSNQGGKLRLRGGVPFPPLPREAGEVPLRHGQ